jgi:homeodomain-containing protein
LQRVDVSDQTEDVERRKRRQGKFPGLQLTATERQTLRAVRSGGRRLSERRWRRIRILELLDRGWKQSQTATAVGTYPCEVRRVGWRYLELGLEAALTDDPRPKPAKLLDATQQAAIVAMVCGPPPLGHARWTVVLTAQEAQQRGVVRKVGRETIRRLFVSHALKPWREKNVVRAAARPGVPAADGSGAGSAEPTVG